MAAIFWMVLKRMSNNLRTVSSLAIGLILAVGVVSSIAVYTNGSLENALIQKLSDKSTLAPNQLSGGTLWFTFNQPQFSASQISQYDTVNHYLRNSVPAKVGLPLLSFTTDGMMGPTSLIPVDAKKDDVTKGRTMQFGYAENLKKHIKLVSGHYPASSPDNGVIEAMVFRGALDTQLMNVGDSFYYPLQEVPNAPHLTVKIVGEFEADQSTDPYFAALVPDLDSALFIPKPEFTNLLIEHKNDLQAGEYNWYFNFDQNQLQFSNVPQLITNLAQMKSEVAQILPGTTLKTDPTKILQSFMGIQGYLQVMLLILSIPILFIIVYYIMLASNLVVERQRTEMAVLRSRGGNAFQILGGFSLELLIIGIISLVVGPLFGVFLAKMMGASNGFLSFVGRKPLPIYFSGDMFLYSSIAVLFAMAASIVPAIKSIRTSIVTQKQELARATRAPLWQRYFLDLLFLALTLYGYYAMQAQQLAAIANIGPNSGFNWTLFLVPGLFVFAVGLVCLRLFPLFIRFITWLLSPLFGVSVTMAMRQIARMPGSYRPLILLLIVTIAFGSYTATAAHTLDNNMADRVYYKDGSDIHLSSDWGLGEVSNQNILNPPKVETSSATAGGGFSDDPGGNASTGLPLGTAYVEPPFKWYGKAPGVLGAARVYNSEIYLYSGRQNKGQGMMMAIDPADFARVTWFRPDLSRENLGVYLQALASHQNGVLVSSDYLAQQGLKLGDTITLATDYGQGDFEVVGDLGYWPSLYQAQQAFFVTNLDYVQNELGIRPYDVWLKLQSNASISPVLHFLKKHGVDAYVSADARSEIVNQRRDPAWTGMVGVLTIGFLTSLAVTVLGFWLYAFLSLRVRFPQFGALRAIGLSVKQLITVIVGELIVTMGLGIAIGTGAGLLTGNLFLPFLQFGQSSLEYQVPPFKISNAVVDLVRIYWILGILLVITLVTLVFVLTRMKIHQAVKLGEEA